MLELSLLASKYLNAPFFLHVEYIPFPIMPLCTVIYERKGKLNLTHSLLHTLYKMMNQSLKVTKISHLENGDGERQAVIGPEPSPEPDPGPGQG
jgi:hypothetical protein